MGIFSWLFGGERPAPPQQELEGETPGRKVRVWWDEVPLDVYVTDPRLYSTVDIAVGWWNGIAGQRVFNFACDAVPETIRVMKDPILRPRLYRAVLVEPASDRPEHGETDLRYCKKRGENVYGGTTGLPGQLINAIVRVHPEPAHPVVTIHEFGHVLGLGHTEKGSLMATRIIIVNNHLPPLRRDQERYVRRLRVVS